MNTKVMRLLLCLFLLCIHSVGYAVSFLSFDPASMATGGAGSATGAGGPQPLLNPVTFFSGEQCCTIGVYSGARLIDRQHFLATAKYARDWHEQLNLEAQLVAAEYALEPSRAQSAPIRDLGATAEQFKLVLNALPEKPLRIGASAGTFITAQNQQIAGGAFHRRYLILGAIIENEPQDIARISDVQAQLYLASDLIDDINQIGQLIEDVEQRAIIKLVRDSVEAGALDPQLYNYQELAGVAPLIEAVEHFGHNVERLQEHLDLKRLLTDLHQQNRDVATEGFSFAGIRVSNYLHQPLPEKINSTVSFSGGEVAESGVNFSAALPNAPRLALGVNFKEMTFSTIEFVQRLDQFEIDQYQQQSTRRDHRFWNIDVALRYQLTPRLTAGAVAKNLRSKQMLTAGENRIHLKPIARVGLAYQHSRLMLAVDADITRNEPLGFDPQKQYIAIGAQIKYWRENTLRLGYRYNYIDGTELPAVGLGFRAWHCNLDLAVTYSPNQDEAGASVQAGLFF